MGRPTVGSPDDHTGSVARERDAEARQDEAVDSIRAFVDQARKDRAAAGTSPTDLADADDAGDPHP